MFVFDARDNEMNFKLFPAAVFKNWSDEKADYCDCKPVDSYRSQVDE